MLWIFNKLLFRIISFKSQNYNSQSYILHLFRTYVHTFKDIVHQEFVFICVCNPLSWCAYQCGLHTLERSPRSTDKLQIQRIVTQHMKNILKDHYNIDAVTLHFVSIVTKQRFCKNVFLSITLERSLGVDIFTYPC